MLWFFKKFIKNKNNNIVTFHIFTSFMQVIEQQFIMRYNYPIHLIFGSYSYYIKVQYYKGSISIIKSLKCKYVLKQYHVFKQFCKKITYNFI